MLLKYNSTPKTTLDNITSPPTQNGQLSKFNDKDTYIINLLMKYIVLVISVKNYVLGQLLRTSLDLICNSLQASYSKVFSVICFEGFIMAIYV